MNKDLCRVKDCYNYGRYCRLPDHMAEIVKPMKQPKKTGDELKEKMKIYRKERRRFITLHPKCAVCGGESNQIHHKQGRIGDLLLDQTKWLAVCLPCHDRITEDSAWAIENGYSESRLKA
jgi:hypothetical protein